MLLDVELLRSTSVLTRAALEALPSLRTEFVATETEVVAEEFLAIEMCVAIEIPCAWARSRDLLWQA